MPSLSKADACTHVSPAATAKYTPNAQLTVGASAPPLGADAGVDALRSTSLSASAVAAQSAPASPVRTDRSVADPSCAHPRLPAAAACPHCSSKRASTATSLSQSRLPRNIASYLPTQLSVGVLNGVEVAVVVPVVVGVVTSHF